MQFLDPLKLALASPLKLMLKQRSVIARHHGLLSPTIIFLSMNHIQAVNFCVLGNVANEQPGFFDAMLTNDRIYAFKMHE